VKSKKCSLLRKEVRKEAEKPPAKASRLKNQQIIRHKIIIFYRDEEELVDYEPESPLKYLSDEEEISPDFEGLPGHGDEPATNIESTSNIPAFSAEFSNMRSRRRSQNFSRGGGSRHPRQRRPRPQIASGK
jgi:hypothetical protein